MKNLYYTCDTKAMFNTVAKQEIIRILKLLNIHSYVFDHPSHPLAFTVNDHDNELLLRLQPMWLELAFIHTTIKMKDINMSDTQSLH